MLLSIGSCVTKIVAFTNKPDFVHTTFLFLKNEQFGNTFSDLLPISVACCLDYYLYPILLHVFLDCVSCFDVHLNVSRLLHFFPSLLYYHILRSVMFPKVFVVLCSLFFLWSCNRAMPYAFLFYVLQNMTIQKCYLKLVGFFLSIVTLFSQKVRFLS